MSLVNETSDYATANFSTAVEEFMIDETNLTTTGHAYPHAVKIEGAFIAPEDGTYHFYLKVNGDAQAVLSDPDNTTEALVRNKLLLLYHTAFFSPHLIAGLGFDRILYLRWLCASIRCKMMLIKFNVVLVYVTGLLVVQ